MYVSFDSVVSGEVGLLVAPLSFTNPFLGYAGNKAMSEKKLLRDVFKEGDVYFNTGDLMLQDHRDFVYFKDRIGDTFRYYIAVHLTALAICCVSFWVAIWVVTFFS